MPCLKSYWHVVSKLTWTIWSILTRALESLKNLHVYGIFITKVYNVWAEKVHTSYLSWHWRVFQNLNINWFVERYLANFHQSTEKFQILRLWWDPFVQSRNCMSLKFSRGTMSHDNEEWYKIWRGIDLLFQNWHEEFDEFWPRHLKI